MNKLKNEISLALSLSLSVSQHECLIFSYLFSSPRLSYFHFISFLLFSSPLFSFLFSTLLLNASNFSMNLVLLISRIPTYASPSHPFPLNSFSSVSSHILLPSHLISQRPIDRPDHPICDVTDVSVIWSERKK